MDERSTDPGCPWQRMAPTAPQAEGAAQRPEGPSLNKDRSKLCGLQKTGGWPLRAKELVLLGVCLFVSFASWKLGG